MNFLTTLRSNLYESNSKFDSAHLFHFKLFEFFIVFQTIYLAWSWGFYTLKITDVVLPLGMANYIDISFMHGNLLPLWNAGLITFLCMVTFFRYGVKWQYLVIFVLFHFQYVARFSIGEIPHSSNLVGLSVLAFAFGLIFFRDLKSQYSFIFGTIILFVGLGYTSAAFSKLIGTGIFWVDGKHLWLWIGEKGTDILSREGFFQPNILQSLALYSVPMATLILLVGLLTEFFGFLLWFKKWRVFVTTALIGMHIGITLSMNIRFDSFIVILIFLGYPWPLLINKLLAKFDGESLKQFVLRINSN